MQLGIQCTISADEMEILSIEDGIAQVRTSEVIPFWGDYVVVQVQLLKAGPNTHEYIDDELQIRFYASEQVSRQIEAYIFEHLNSHAVSMGHRAMTDLFA